jgi:hypothetical protein
MLQKLQDGDAMKRLFLVFAGALLWASVSPAPVSASWWKWGHHSKSNANAASKEHKQKTHHSWFHHDKAQRNSGGALYTSGPKSVGWFHKMPGPAGAGS